jgi:hypothetical protein
MLFKVTRSFHYDSRYSKDRKCGLVVKGILSMHEALSLISAPKRKKLTKK